MTVGFALCGSFCTLEQALAQVERLVELRHNVIPIVSAAVYETDTRFGTAAGWMQKIEAACGRKPIHTLAGAEPIGPQALLDILVIAPCTGNTLAKLAAGIADTSVTLACKAHLRNNRPVVLGISTNDALSVAARNIGLLLARKHVYFVPFAQDDPMNKPSSAIADLTLLPETIQAAMAGRQLQPLLISPDD
jgi:dipicolinate synthase subunit B